LSSNKEIDEKYESSEINSKYVLKRTKVDHNHSKYDFILL